MMIEEFLSLRDVEIGDRVLETLLYEDDGGITHFEGKGRILILQSWRTTREMKRAAQHGLKSVDCENEAERGTDRAEYI
jgi:hypothetical protein